MLAASRQTSRHSTRGMSASVTHGSGTLAVIAGRPETDCARARARDTDRLRPTVDETYGHGESNRFDVSWSDVADMIWSSTTAARGGAMCIWPQSRRVSADVRSRWSWGDKRSSTGRPAGLQITQRFGASEARRSGGTTPPRHPISDRAEAGRSGC